MHVTNFTHSHTSTQQFNHTKPILEQPTDLVTLTDDFYCRDVDISSIKLTRREKAIFLAIASFIFKGLKHKCFASQDTLGQLAVQYGWKVMNRRKVNEVIAKLVAVGLIDKSEQKSFGRGRFSTLNYTLTERGEAYCLATSNQIVYKAKTPRPLSLTKTGHVKPAEIKNGTQSLSSSSLRSEDEFTNNSEILEEEEAELFLLLQKQIPDKEAADVVQKVKKQGQTQAVVQNVNKQLSKGRWIRDLGAYATSLAYRLAHKDRTEAAISQREREWAQQKAAEQKAAKTRLSGLGVDSLGLNVANSPPLQSHHSRPAVSEIEPVSEPSTAETAKMNFALFRQMGIMH